MAASWLRAQGLRVLRRNFRWGDSGEIDLVCRQGDSLVFVEVKSNTGKEHGAPGRAVNRHKRQLLRRGARNWLRLLKKDVPVRFDIMEVWLPPLQRPELRWTQHAFTMVEGSSHAGV